MYNFSWNLDTETRFLIHKSTLITAKAILWQNLQTNQHPTSIQNDFIIKNDMKKLRRLDDKWNNFLLKILQCTNYVQSAIQTLMQFTFQKRNHFCFVVWHVISITEEWNTRKRNNRKTSNIFTCIRRKSSKKDTNQKSWNNETKQ